MWGLSVLDPFEHIYFSSVDWQGQVYGQVKLSYFGGRVGFSHQIFSIQLNNCHMWTIVFTLLDLRTLVIYVTCMNSETHLTKLLYSTNVCEPSITTTEMRVHKYSIRLLSCKQLAFVWTVEASHQFSVLKYFTAISRQEYFCWLTFYQFSNLKFITNYSNFFYPFWNQNFSHQFSKLEFFHRPLQFFPRTIRLKFFISTFRSRFLSLISIFSTSFSHHNF